ncbi:MAG: hypothetical protein GX442_07540 [Candidatus Riflebacteria bacterium]|nr:hypothetical protein [Candidatus Riflebacteria bacterium]
MITDPITRLPPGRFFGRGFSLVEVVVATTVMALMIVSFLSFVQFAGDAWERSQMTINLVSEANLVLDFIERELDGAVAVDVPQPGDPATYTLRYGKWVYDGVSPPPASLTFEVVWPYAWTGVATTTLMARILTTGDPRFTGSGWATGNTVTNNTVDVDRYNYELGRHIASFAVRRLGSRKLEVAVQVSVTRAEDEIAQELLVTREMLLH